MRYRFVPNRRSQSTPSYREMSSIRLLARRAFSRAPAAEARAFSAETAVGGTPGAMTHRNLGNNVIVGGTIFSFVGAVYWYTVHNLRKQGGQLEDDLDELAGEIEQEQHRQSQSSSQ